MNVDKKSLIIAGSTFAAGLIAGILLFGGKSGRPTEDATPRAGLVSVNCEPPTPQEGATTDLTPPAPVAPQNASATNEPIRVPTPHPLTPSDPTTPASTEQPPAGAQAKGFHSRPTTSV